MKRIHLRISPILGFPILGLVFLGFGLLGCNSSSTPNTNSTDPAPNQTQADDDHDGHNHSHSGEHGNHSHDGDDHADHDHGGDQDKSMTAMEKMEKGLANLSEEDRASAMKQHFCPVTGDMLGTMGEPIKVTVKDQVVWLCCEGCKKDLLADPAPYLEKLKK